MDIDLNLLVDYFFFCSIKEIDKRNEIFVIVILEIVIVCV